MAWRLVVVRGRGICAGCIEKGEQRIKVHVWSSGGVRNKTWEERHGFSFSNSVEGVWLISSYSRRRQFERQWESMSK